MSEYVTVALEIRPESLELLLTRRSVAVAVWMSRRENGSYRLHAQVPKTEAGDEALREQFRIDGDPANPLLEALPEQPHD